MAKISDIMTVISPQADMPKPLLAGLRLGACPLMPPPMGAPCLGGTFPSYLPLPLPKPLPLSPSDVGKIIKTAENFYIVRI